MRLTDEAIEGLTKRGIDTTNLDAAIAQVNARTARKKRSTPEFDAQKALFDWLRLWEHRERRFVWIHASLNGVPLSPKCARDARSAGMKSGIWDITIDYSIKAFQANYYEGARIEMKIGKNKLTEAQIAYRDAHPQLAYCVAYSWLEAARFICSYLDISDREILDSIRDEAQP